MYMHRMRACASFCYTSQSSRFPQLHHPDDASDILSTRPGGWKDANTRSLTPADRGRRHATRQGCATQVCWWSSLHVPGRLNSAACAPDDLAHAALLGGGQFRRALLRALPLQHVHHSRRGRLAHHRCGGCRGRRLLGILHAARRACTSRQQPGQLLLTAYPFTCTPCPACPCACVPPPLQRLRLPSPPAHSARRESAHAPAASTTQRKGSQCPYIHACMTGEGRLAGQAGRQDELLAQEEDGKRRIEKE